MIDIFKVGLGSTVEIYAKTNEVGCGYTRW